MAKTLTISTWAIVPNHLRLLVRTGATLPARPMRSLLTGYAGASVDAPMSGRPLSRRPPSRGGRTERDGIAS